MTSVLFRTGDIVATVGAMELVEAWAEKQGLEAVTVVRMLTNEHAAGMWGKVSTEDAAANRKALTTGERILSEYWLPDEERRIWVLTEADRSVTTLLLPSEY